MLTRRFPLAVLPTPLVRAHRLERALGRGPLLIKRDDLAGFGVAGNKARPLEYLLGAAVEDGCDVLVTGGGSGSNFCPAAALAARTAGLDCELVIAGEPDPGANPALAAVAGARLHRTGTDDREHVDAAVDRLAAELAAQGRRPLSVPRGGSTALGAVGFAVAAGELAAALDEPPAMIVLPVGSGGSAAGLLVGLAEQGLRWSVLGVSVSREPAHIRERIVGLAAECTALWANVARGGTDLLELVDARAPGFGRAGPHAVERARLALDTEGLLLDETYGAKAFSAMVDRCGELSPGPIVYWHTGGIVGAVRSVCARGAR